MNNLKNYLNDKIKANEYVEGYLTTAEKICIKNDFFKKFLNFAIKYNYDIMDLLEDVNIYSKLDDLLDYDELEAVKFVNGVDLNE